MNQVITIFTFIFVYVFFNGINMYNKPSPSLENVSASSQVSVAMAPQQLLSNTAPSSPLLLQVGPWKMTLKRWVKCHETWENMWKTYGNHGIFLVNLWLIMVNI